MAGQHLDPENDWEVSDIQEKATALNYTKHGEMFSANNMAKLAKKVFDCQAEKVKGSHEILTKLPKLLDLLINERKLILVPYDSDADQWPCLRKGHKAHWGLIFGLALIMPYKNKVFYEAKHLGMLLCPVQNMIWL